MEEDAERPSERTHPWPVDGRHGSPGELLGGGPALAVVVHVPAETEGVHRHGRYDGDREREPEPPEVALEVEEVAGRRVGTHVRRVPEERHDGEEDAARREAIRLLVQRYGGRRLARVR